MWSIITNDKQFKGGRISALNGEGNLAERMMIDIRGLHKRYPKKDPENNWLDNFKESMSKDKRKYIDALDGVNLQVKKGEVIGILGPNGAGKTTMLKVMAGFLYPDSGKVLVNGLDIVEDRHEVRCSCNFLRAGGWIIFDYKYPLDKLLLFWGVFMGLRHDEAIKAADKALDTVGLGDKKKEFTENLSAGMRQKLNLARCLMIDRPIYLLDEPTTNIDPYSSEFIRNFIRENLAKRGTTVVLATHNLWEAEKVCDRVVILDKGQIVKVGTAEELRKQLSDDLLLLDISGNIKDLAKELIGLDLILHVEFQKDPEDIIPGASRLAIYGKEMHRLAPHIIDISKEFCKVHRVDIQTPTLNDIFVQVMKERGEA